MFTQPIKADIDRVLSNLMHSARHRLMIEMNCIMAEATQFGYGNTSRVIVQVASVADQIHQASMQEVVPVLLAYIERLQVPPAEVTSWVRPQLENLGNSLLDVVPPNGFPADHQRIIAQYQTVFQQQLDALLRDIETSFVKGADQVENKDEEWILAAEAARLLKPVFGTKYLAQNAICKRAHSGLIRARAVRFMVDAAVRDDKEVPKDFWWAEGGNALAQDWPAGDFDTWVDSGETRLRAFGVSFLRANIETMIPPGTPAATPAKAGGGRPKAEWWEDLWIEMCRLLYTGELIPKTQADIEKAMHQWIDHHGHTAGETTVRERARKLWRALNEDGN